MLLIDYIHSVYGTARGDLRNLQAHITPLQDTVGGRRRGWRVSL